MSQTFSCGFVRAQLIASGANYHPNVLVVKAYENVLEQFGHVNELSHQYFGEKLKDFLSFLQKKKWNSRVFVNRLMEIIC